MALMNAHDMAPVACAAIVASALETSLAMFDRRLKVCCEWCR